jgi:hypothetical protein
MAQSNNSLVVLNTNVTYTSVTDALAPTDDTVSPNVVHNVVSGTVTFSGPSGCYPVLVNGLPLVVPQGFPLSVTYLPVTGALPSTGCNVTAQALSVASTGAVVQLGDSSVSAAMSLGYTGMTIPYGGTGAVVTTGQMTGFSQDGIAPVVGTKYAYVYHNSPTALTGSLQVVVHSVN